MFMLLVLPSFAQDDEAPGPCGPSEVKKANKLIEEARKNPDYREVKELVNRAVEEDDRFADAWYFLAGRAKRKGDFRTAADAFAKAIEICPGQYPEAYFNLGTYLYSLASIKDTARYREASTYLKKFLAFEESPEELKSENKRRTMDEYRTEAEKTVDRADFLYDAYAHPVPFEPKIVEGISTPADEVLPIISPDRELAFFTRRYETRSKGIVEQVNYIEKFSFSEGMEGRFSEGGPMQGPFNTNANEGGATITADNRYLYFTICKPDAAGYNNCDIYTSSYENGQWTSITNLGPQINGNKSWEAQPTVSADGNTLYFASIREGNIGHNKEHQTADLYRSVKDASGQWGKAENMGKTINSAEDEKSPFIHTDSQTLYFASNGHAGMGGYDIFFVKGDEEGKFGKPKNIGYPINNESDELSFFVSTDGKLAYFASNKLKGVGGWDLYSFDLYKEARPEKVLFMKGTLTDENGKAVAGARIELKNMVTKKVTQVNVNNEEGKNVAVVTMKKDDDYLFTVKKEGYAFNSKMIRASDSLHRQPLKESVAIKPVEVGGTYTLNNISFATNSSDLTSESEFILDNFMDFLKENPGIRTAIHGHTDNAGDDQWNMQLSQTRALSVYRYLISKGIDASRLSHKGFGKTKPVADNGTEEGRAKNRRTEFVITGK
jgi:outer membrane protein OmpA-like peptidoglycan-associated protein/tetratricopeptide (TPR) repeat protein